MDVSVNQHEIAREREGALTGELLEILNLFHETRDKAMETMIPCPFCRSNYSVRRFSVALAIAPATHVVGPARENSIPKRAATAKNPVNSRRFGFERESPPQLR
jgi:hypothetical protein